MTILDFLFPKKCLECGKTGKYICESCLQKVNIAPCICPICTNYSYGGNTHKSCKKPRGLDKLITGWKYYGVIRKSILALKYRFANDIADELVVKYLDIISNNYINKNIILIPIPLHKKRKNWRGFNQSEELGRRIASNLNIKFVPDLLIKNISTQPQARLNKAEREKNMKHAFQVNPKYKNIKYYEVIIFDDVWTTGTTMKEACKVLKRNNAKKVWGMTITG